MHVVSKCQFQKVLPNKIMKHGNVMKSEIKAFHIMVTSKQMLSRHEIKHNAANQNDKWSKTDNMYCSNMDILCFCCFLPWRGHLSLIMGWMGWWWWWLGEPVITTTYRQDNALVPSSIYPIHHYEYHNMHAYFSSHIPTDFTGLHAKLVPTLNIVFYTRYSCCMYPSQTLSIFIVPNIQ